MKDLAHEKFARLMTDLDELESQVEGLLRTKPDSPALHELQEHLAEKRSELARISDGCGTPHPQN
jgi:hypothetical protein